ncbi:primosomal protein N' [Thiocystis violascens]|uniref:Replication restart protein PriA n=1 Tax=Thiocystis violascens (strain ATCC 17096 / DSM 198 / 6111) TaxID=765911 RepID=I3YF70_THIV6|nr:primosomal protein N' [Thiocystis violascens]AFL75638.1 replication restart DNA helicase PriA [Thiocystis violascens DSM 198]
MQSNAGRPGARQSGRIDGPVVDRSALVSRAPTPSESGPAILRVAVAAPLAELFDYLPPVSPAPVTLTPGLRLLVPFGRGRRVGMLLRIASHTEQDPARLKRVESVLDARPLLSPADLRLIEWAAAYYRQPIGEALFTALPARLRDPAPVLDERIPGIQATPAGLTVALDALNRAPRQRDLLALARAAPAGLALADLRASQGDCAATLRALRAKGLIETCHLAPGLTPSLPPPVSALAGPALNADQQAAVNAILGALGGFRAFLLDGVTGSGKTEVYIRLIEAVIAAGGQALVVVPEIGLTPQLRARFIQRLPGPVAVLHSALNARERERNWHRAALGEATLVLGTRSAVFVPLPRLALILVDEEHDASLKQQEGFRYSARDLAVRRAQLTGCPVVLGSATPALETLHNARLDRYGWLKLPERAGLARPPTISLLDIRDQPLQAGLSSVLRADMRTELAAGNQVLLFLNRRGYAPILTCHACGWVGGCPHCDARLTLHLNPRKLWCHHCGWSQPVPSLCPACQGSDLRRLGQGTERLEDNLRPLFPEVGIARIDRDSTRRKGELDRLLGAVSRGEIQILLGTQMLAKGHDFPGVTLVGILDLDHALYASDFRAPERTAQLIVQVAGRAGRAERPGRVVLQTRHPEHPLLQSLLREGYGGFATVALGERRDAELPPFAHLALVRAEAPGASEPLAFLRAARVLAEGLIEAADAPGVHLLGPIPAPMERRAGRYRAQLLVQCGERSRLQRFLAHWSPALRGLSRTKGLRWSLDVDPQEML